MMMTTRSNYNYNYDYDYSYEYSNSNSSSSSSSSYKRNLEEFWCVYVNEHSKAWTRRWHFVGTLLAVVCVVCSALLSPWVFPLAPLLAYGLAWYSHLFVEGNYPITSRYPLWSLLCDLRMFSLMLTGRMDREIKRLGKRPILLHPPFPF